MESVDTPRSTRRSARKAAEEAVLEDETEAMEVDEEKPSNPLLELTATSKFSNFTLWLPDNRTRELDDEYVRTLKEWVPLAELVCPPVYLLLTLR